MDWPLVLGALMVGVCVGLTGMGGGALMTPMLVLLFGVPPLAAVSSDLAASAVMKPVGSIVHLRHGTVRMDLVRWLCLGSVPAAFAGVFIIRLLGHGPDIQSGIQKALGVALVIAASGLFVRAYLRLAERARARDGRRAPDPSGPPVIEVRVVRTVIIGLVGGVVVGMTSVGSGSLMIIALMLLYPTLRASELVGTDLVQAVPLVVSAAVAHIAFGEFELGLTGSLLLGCIPGAWIGAQLSSHLPGALIRRALAFVLLASALKLLGVGTVATGIVLAALLVLAGPIWMLLRRVHGFPASPRTERAQAGQAGQEALVGAAGQQQRPESH